MRTPRFLQQAGILGFLLLLGACAKHSSASTSSPNGPPSTKPTPPPTLSGDLLDEVIQQGVPKNIAVTAFNKYDDFSDRVQNTDYLTIIDFTRESGVPRLWMINTATGNVDALLVAHGLGSDPQATGLPTKFSNIPNSKMSSLGSYLISEKFQSTNHGTAMRLDGLESTNSLVRDRAIVMHSATYVSSTLTKMGMSWGCTAISLDWIGRALDRLSGGSFMYVFGPQSANISLTEMQIQGIMTDPAYTWVNESEEAPVEGVR